MFAIAIRKGVSLFAGLAAAVALGWAVEARADCKILNLGELPVKVVDRRMLVEGSINGQPVRLMVDTGASDNMLFRDPAKRLGLSLVPLRGVTLYGVGGEVRLKTTRVKTLSLGSLVTHDDVMLVDAERIGAGADVDGLIGQRFLSQADLEVDLGHGVLRFLKPQGCADGQMAYWATTAYSEVAIEGTNNQGSNINAFAKLNGVPIGASFDTGTQTSIVTLAAAEAAGVRPGGEGVVPVGRLQGTGPKSLPVWIGTFKTFSLGDETIGNAKLRISDLFAFNKESSASLTIPEEAGAATKMLIGLDFFKSHHVLIAYSRRKMYFTYSGGPVFELRDEGDAEAVPLPAR